MSAPAERPPIELVRPSYYGQLVVFYAIVAAYGATAVVWNLPTLVISGGDQFAIIWAVLICAGALSAMVGVLVTRRSTRGWIEVASGLLIVSLLTGYGVGLLMRGLDGHDGAIPTAWLPIAMSVQPAWRMLVLAADGISLKRKPR